MPLYNQVYDLFRSSPELVRKFLYLVPVKFRLGGNDFERMYRFILESERWSPEQLRSYQEHQLGDLLKYAVRTVPFYGGIELDDDPFRSLESFPVITKTTIQEQCRDLLAEGFPANRRYLVSSGGSTGNLTRFYSDNAAYAREWAFVMAAWRRVGLVPGDPIVSFRAVNFPRADTGDYWQLNPLYNALECSPYHLSSEHLPRYLRRIRAFAPKYLHGYPSAISIFAKYLEESGETLPGIRAVFCVSEKTYDWQRALIERALKTRVFSFYGMSEHVIMAPECEVDTRYHCFPQYGVTEVLDGNGDAVSPGEAGILVGTGFMNRCMPFIRYDTGDSCTLSAEPCACGRNHVLLEKLTPHRQQGFVLGRGGSMIPLMALFTHSPVMDPVARFQFEQRREGEVVLKVVPKGVFSETELTALADEYARKIGGELAVTVEPVDAIALTGAGKHNFLVQRLQVDWNRLC